MPRWSDSISRDRSSIGSRKVPVQVPPCQMLNTAIPVSAYQLRRMLRELPRTSKKTSPSRGSGAASDADMLPMVAASPSVCPVRTDYDQAPQTSGEAEILVTARESWAPACAGGQLSGIIVRRLHCLGPTLPRPLPVGWNLTP